MKYNCEASFNQRCVLGAVPRWMPDDAARRMQLRDAAANLPAPVGGLDPPDRGADGGHHRRARAPAALPARVRLP